ncbi:AVAST type 1 anti-phage system protein Avs1c [Delftia tsuruhatensis]
METPSSRAEFEECMQMVREQLIQGKLMFNKGLRGPESLLKVRLLPNRRIDLLSIDESARLQGNMARQFMVGAFDDVLPK